MPHSCQPYGFTGAGREPNPWSREVNMTTKACRSIVSVESTRRGKRRTTSSTGRSLGAAKPNERRPAVMATTTGRSVRYPMASKIDQKPSATMVCGSG